MPEVPLAEGEIRVTSLEYGSLMEAVESDHKPVYALLRVNVPVIDQACASCNGPSIHAAAVHQYTHYGVAVDLQCKVPHRAASNACRRRSGRMSPGYCNRLRHIGRLQGGALMWC